MSESTLAQWAGRASAGEALYLAGKEALALLETLYPTGANMHPTITKLRDAVALAEDNATDRKKP